MKKKFLLFLLIIISGRIYAQVNLQTGSATFSLPMFNWQDDKSRLNSIVALSYSSGNGLKVNDIASNVGQGWSLLAGGMITRIQAGEPDDQKPKEGNLNDISKYPPGYLYNSVPPTLGAPVALTRYPIYKDMNHIYKQHNPVAADREMDHFAFQFNGRSGIFVLDKPNSSLNNSEPGEALTLGDSKLIIKFQTNDNLTYNNKGIRTTIASFTIQDESGLIFKFTQPDITKILRSQFCDKNLNKQIQPKFKNNHVYHQASYDDNDPDISNPYVINGWYLTEIEDALTHRKVRLYYSVRNISANAGTSISNYRSNNSGLFTPEKNYSIIFHSTSVTATPAIDSISYPDGHKVIFNYGNQRIDLNQDLILSSVDIKYQNRYLSKYKLITSYFILNRYGNPVSDYQKQCARLCLRSVKKIGVDLKSDDPPYIFDYYLGSSDPKDIVPPPFFHLKDIWGFYNADNSKADNGQAIPVYESLSDLNNDDLKGLCFLNNNSIYSAKEGFAKNGLLKQITYPTGGSINYEYSQNTGIIPGQSTANVGGVHVSKTSVTDGGYANGCNNPVFTNYSYTLDGSGLSSLWGLEKPVISMVTYNYFLPEEKYFHGSVFPPSLGCDFRYKYPGILATDQAVNISLTGQILQFAMNIYSTISTIKTVIQAISSSNPVTLIIQIIIDIGFSCIGNHHVDNETHINYNSDLNSSNPLPTQFKRVEVSEGSGTNGKTIYEFTSDDDYAIWRPDNTGTFCAEQRYAYWAYGLPKKITVKDITGNPVKQTENVYDTTKAQEYIGYGKTSFFAYRSCKALVISSSSQKNPDWENPETYNPYNPDGSPSANFQEVEQGENMNVRIYPHYRGRMELSTTYERVFKQGSLSDYIETVTDYSYSSNNYQVNSLTTSQSNGDKIFKTIYYSGDGYGSSGGLKQNNILNIPVLTQTGITKAGSSQLLYLNENLTEFVSLANGDIKPSRILEKRVSRPSLDLNVPYIESQTYFYDAAGNLSGFKDEGNHIVTNIYDSSEKYVTASVVNADPNTDQPSYTSFETGNLGGWILSGAQRFNSAAAVTGNRSFNLTAFGFLANHLSATLNTAKPYRLSFWSTNTITVNGNATLIKSAPAVNGFTYYEYNISQGTSSVTVSGNATIDELRLYPQTARMRTVTYDPLIGKTSECDENNRITYYEYDDNARLGFIKDENRNVVKMYEYNIAKKPTGCPTTYFNLAVSEIFIKQCSAGFIGDPVLYTIPEGTYTSSISQDAVDQMVQNNLDVYGQQYANTNGFCHQLYCNDATSQTFTKEGCDVGYVGTTYTYTVPAGRYCSTDPNEVQEMVQDDIDANGQALANFQLNAQCTPSPDPVWEATEEPYCQNGHKMVHLKDVNPNSQSYNQINLIDLGVDPACGGGSSCGPTIYSGPNCDNEGYKWIINCCEQGYKIYYTYTHYNGLWYCVYHYEFSDGSFSDYDYVDWNTGSPYQGNVCPSSQ